VAGRGLGTKIGTIEKGRRPTGWRRINGVVERLWVSQVIAAVTCSVVPSDWRAALTSAVSLVPGITLVATWLPASRASLESVGRLVVRMGGASQR
jgi:hypothetical protein